MDTTSTGLPRCNEIGCPRSTWGHLYCAEHRPTEWEFDGQNWINVSDPTDRADD